MKQIGNISLLHVPLTVPFKNSEYKRILWISCGMLEHAEMVLFNRETVDINSISALLGHKPLGQNNIIYIFVYI